MSLQLHLINNQVFLGHLCEFYERPRSSEIYQSVQQKKCCCFWSPGGYQYKTKQKNIPPERALNSEHLNLCLIQKPAILMELMSKYKKGPNYTMSKY